MKYFRIGRGRIPACLGALVFLALLLGLSGEEAMAAETGTMKGIIADADGQALPGVTVTIEGENLQGSRNAVTGEKGEFRIGFLPPGEYTIKAELDGFQTVIQQELWVRLGVDTLIDIELPPSKISEEITVTAQAPLIDVTTAQIGENFSSETMELLPTTRNYQDLFNFVPGVQGRTDTEYGGESGGNPSVRGEGKNANNYLIDGISARDPETKGYGHNINFDAIEEIQIMTDGFNAEYGRATGLLANVITKSGGNQLDGSVLLNYHTTGSGGDPEIQRTGRALGQLERNYINPVLNVGGPIVKDKLWYFGSLEYLDQMWEDTTQDANYGFSYTRDDENWAPFLKLTWSMNENHSINASYIGQRFDRSNRDDFETAPESQRSDATDLDHLAATYRGILSPNSFLEVKFGQTNVNRAIIPYGSMEDPRYFDRSTGEVWGGAQSYQYDTTQEDYKAHFTHYLDDLGGNHSFKAGFEYLKADKFEVWLLPGNGYNYTYYEGVPESLSIRFQQPGDGNENTGYVAFLQDTWDVLDNLTLNLGYRYESLAMDNNQGVEYFDLDSHAPRVGVVWDVTKDAVNVVKGFYGRFYDFTGLDISWVMNSASSSSYHNYLWNPDAPGEWTDTNGDTWNGGWEWDSSQGGEEGTPLFAPDEFDPNLKPHHTDKIIAGYERKLTDTQAMGLRYINGRTRDLIEDVALDDGSWLVTNPGPKRRDYDAVELTYNKAMSNNFMLFASYSWSRSRGTNPGQNEWGDSGGSSDTIGVFMDAAPSDPPGSTFYDLGTLYDDRGWYGYLPDDIRNHVKVNGLYRAPWAIDVGLSLEWSDGQPYSRRSWVGGAYQDYFGFPEGRGTYRLNNAYWLDLHLEKTFPIGERYSIGLFADILNLTDSDTVVSVWEWDDPEAEAGNPFGLPRYRQTARSYRFGLRFAF